MAESTESTEPPAPAATPGAEAPKPRPAEDPAQAPFVWPRDINAPPDPKPSWGRDPEEVGHE
jgi:hypothetical protein